MIYNTPTRNSDTSRILTETNRIIKMANKRKPETEDVFYCMYFARTWYCKWVISMLKMKVSYLMTTANEIKVILIQKISNYICSKGTWNTSVTICPALNVSIRIGPQQITEKTIIRNISRPRDIPYLIQIFQLWRKSTMHTKYLLINECRHRQAIKAISKYFPKPNIKSPLALIVKSVNPIDLSIFMVSPQEMNFIWISYFVGQKQTYCLQTLLATINIIPKKEVVCSRRVPAMFKQSEEILVLTVYITCKRLPILKTLDSRAKEG